MNRIAATFERLSAAGKKALIPYITPEFPLRGSTVPILKGLESGGAGMIEIGIPFSDPLADGMTIQHSSEIAIANGATIPVILAAVREFRSTSSVPVLLMGYYNPILHFGIERFVKQCVDHGVDGLIIPDLPPEEGTELRNQCKSNGVSNVFLIAPTTPDERMRTVDASSTDFSYCVSVTGVTGARARIGTNGEFDAFLKRVRENVKKRFVVGFGISGVEQVRHVWKYADGAVVGSALIQELESAQSPEEAATKARKFIEGILPR